MKLTNAQKEKYFKEGFETRREGYSEKANPYKGLSEGEHWLQGWNCQNRMIAGRIVRNMAPKSGIFDEW